MGLLILGLVIFLGVHMLATARAMRARLIARLGAGPYRGLFSLVAAIGLGLVVWGFGRYRAAGEIPVWDPPAALHPVALLLVWLAFVALAATYSPPGKIKATLRHPTLAGVKAWALAHLLVNGDLGAIVLFGSFLAWAVFDRIAAKRRGDVGAPPVARPTAGDAVAVAAGTAAYVAMYWLHPLVIGVPAT